MIRVAEAETAEQLDAVRGFIREFVVWARALSPDDAVLVDRYFSHGDLERELAGLPGRYAPPAGSLLVATVDGIPAGCAALRPLGNGLCEMKRVFVRPEHHGRGIGRALAQRLIADAKEKGYRAMRLDTSRNQLAAIALYAGLGFRRIPAYYAVPPEFEGFLIYFERDH